MDNELDYEVVVYQSRGRATITGRDSKGGMQFQESCRFRPSTRVDEDWLFKQVVHACPAARKSVKYVWQDSLAWDPPQADGLTQYDFIDVHFTEERPNEAVVVYRVTSAWQGPQTRLVRFDEHFVPSDCGLRLLARRTLSLDDRETMKVKVVVSRKQEAEVETEESPVNTEKDSTVHIELTSEVGFNRVTWKGLSLEVIESTDSNGVVDRLTIRPPKGRKLTLSEFKTVASKFSCEDYLLDLGRNHSGGQITMVPPDSE